ncbi:hypothetical protein psyc5s11_10140 [Clostridium gelidum]|uniref:SCP domain-containing protein n=1 Tax=Clostridium gelidum TaxID=704125 RepID=A0ABM7SZ60_9CLOT|nr:CAP domain-containing protein [Clostridium gelidum]BCZ44947.1 hypothetical protein psyc5s11_10140 [Clostridium gelidum]
MKKASLKKLVSVVVVAVTITTLLPLGVSAQWRQNTDSTWSYIEENTMANGWKTISDTWYYFNSNGKMNTGWICDSGTWYYLDKTGAMKTGWINDNGKWYYLDSTGEMQTGVVKINTKTYCLNNSGEMLVGSVNVGNKLYEFASDGQAIGAIPQTNINSNQEFNGTVNISTNVDVNELPTLPQNYKISVQATAENKILELMNEKRTEVGLQPLTIDNTLLQVARYKSNHMIQYNYFDHTNSDGTKWTNWLKEIGYRYTTTGENIAYNTYDAVELFNQWWNSSEHRANMMNASYTKVGIGVINGNDKYMGTQEFSN